MKTFKLVSLQVMDGANVVDIELKDGLIINKEDQERNWIIEAYLDRKYEEFFQSWKKSGKDISLVVVISRKENDPALFQASILSLNKLGDHISVLFIGKVNRSRNDYAERLLKVLVQDDLSSEELLAAFKEKMMTKPLL